MRGELFMDGTKLNRHLDEVVKWQKGEWFAPIHMEVSLTNVCNQHCTFCYIDWSHGKERMSDETAERLIRDAKKVGIKSALIAGEGEPTVNKAYLKAIATAGEVGFDIALNSNMVHVDEKEIEEFLPNLQWLRISFQSPRRETYAQIHRAPVQHFDKAVRNIESVVRTKRDKKLNVAVGLQQVLIEENGGTVAEMAKLAKEIGVDYWVVKPCHPHDMNKSGFKTVGDLVAKYEDQLKEAAALSTDKFKAVVRWNFLQEAQVPRDYTKCLALPFIIQIGANGGVYTCYPWAHKKEHEYGNLNRQSLEEILKSPNFKKTCGYVEENVDVSKCMPTCRQHNANKYLWWLSQEVPQHLNFI